MSNSLKDSPYRLSWKMKMVPDKRDFLWKRECRVDYVDQYGNGQKTSGRLLISEDYYYHTGARTHVVLIRQSDIDYNIVFNLGGFLPSPVNRY